MVLGRVSVPLNRPLHSVVEGDKWRSPVEDLAAESSPRVEDGSMGRASKGVLSVRAQSVADDAPLR